MSDMISAIKYCMPTFEFLLLLWFWCSFLWHWLLHLCLLSVYLKDCMWSNLQGLPLHIICILQTIKYWRWERPGNETNFHNKLCMPGCRLHVWTLHAQVAILRMMLCLWFIGLHDHLSDWSISTYGRQVICNPLYITLSENYLSLSEPHCYFRTNTPIS